MSLLLLGAGPSGSGSSEPVEEITNGDFETGALAPWTVNSGSCFVAEEAPFNVSCSDSLGLNANSRIQQTFSVESGSTYRVSYDASSTNSGQVEFTIGGVSVTDPLVLSSFFQSRSFDVVATASNSLGIVIGVESLTFKTVGLDNISVLKL
jgi:hypothetical protein